MNLDRTSLYHDWTKQKTKDDISIEQLCEEHAKNPRYGVKRLAIALGWSEEKTRRIRNLAGIEALRKTKKGHKAQAAEIDAPENKLRPYWIYKNPEDPRLGYSFEELTRPELGIWVQDFTYIGHQGKFLYLAVTLSLADREAVGWAFGFHHDAELICASLEDALEHYSAPFIVHNDCGSEYLSQKHYDLCTQEGILMSASDPGEPWQNGFMESFFNTFKEEMSGKIRLCKDPVELYEKIANWIHYYNHERIHTALRMSPADYAARLQEASLLRKAVEKVPEMNASHSLRLPSKSLSY